MKVNKDDYCHVCGDRLRHCSVPNAGYCRSCWNLCGPESQQFSNLAESRCHYWLNVGAEDYRLHFGEMSAQEIRTVRAVLAHILEIPVP